MVADIEEPGKLDASESHARRLNAKEKLHLKGLKNCRFPITEGTAKLLGRSRNSRMQSELAGSGDLCEGFRRRSEGSQPATPKLATTFDRLKEISFSSSC